MLHCDEETLSLLALGESGEAADRAHVADCERCTAEVAAMRRVVNTVRSDRVAPPPRVWEQIAAATGVQVTPHLPATPAPVVEPAVEAAVLPPAAPEGPARRPVLPGQRSWRDRLDRRLLSVAAGCLVVGVLAGVFGARQLSDSTDPGKSDVVAGTALAGLPAAPNASGEADVTQSAQGRTLALDVRKLGAPDGFYEVWLIDKTVTKMVPVGVLSGSTGRFTLPAGVNLADYPLVDVSVEPLDGNPAHSGRSVLRGTLQS